MTRKFYNSVTVEMEQLPKWLNTSQSGKARKAANDDGETERLKKRGREKQSRRGMKEVERMRRYEEGMKRKEKLVKKDKRRSEMANRDVTERYNIGRTAKNENNCKPGRWQVGDGYGSRRELEMVKRGNVERKGQGKRCKTDSDNEFKGRNFGQCRQAVKINVKNSSGKDRTREWVQIIQTEKTSTERCLIGRSWAWYSVPQEETDSETSDQEEADDHDTIDGGKLNCLEDLPASWPICRFCLDESPYIPVKKPVTAENWIAVSTNIPLIGNVYPDDPSNTDVTSSTMAIKDKHQTKKSFLSRVLSVFRSLSGRTRRRTVQ